MRAMAKAVERVGATEETMGKGTREWNMKGEAWEGVCLKKESDIPFR